MNKFRKFMLHNSNIIGVLYFGIPITLILILPLLIGLIVNSEELCYLSVFIGNILTLCLIPIIDKIVDKYNVSGTISNQYAAARLENSSNIVEEDNKLAEEYSNPELYNEESNNEELPPAEEVVHTEEEIAAINPQTDNESEEFDKDSMEIIDENKPSIIRTCDKNGNIIYYEVSADGKKKRVKREYAEAHM